MLLSHNNVGEMNFNVYRKPTRSGKYLGFKSNNPIAHKNSVI